MPEEMLSRSPASEEGQAVVSKSKLEDDPGLKLRGFVHELNELVLREKPNMETLLAAVKRLVSETIKQTTDSDDSMLRQAEEIQKAVRAGFVLVMRDLLDDFESNGNRDSIKRLGALTRVVSVIKFE